MEMPRPRSRRFRMGATSPSAVALIRKRHRHGDDSMKTASGIGLGLRVDMAKRFLDEQPAAVGWVEVHPENYIGRGGLYRSYLERAMERYPVVTHGLSTCLGNTEPHDAEYLGMLRRFLGDVGTPWHSEHLCFGMGAGAALHDLLPLPFTE